MKTKMARARPAPAYAIAVISLGPDLAVRWPAGILNRSKTPPPSKRFRPTWTRVRPTY
jgi:hypothetical protein